MADVRLTLACWNYEHTRALQSGQVKPDGIELTYLCLPVEEIFFRMLKYQEFEIAEMSLSSYVMSLFQEQPPFIAIPVFPLRHFRHSGIFVHTASGIDSPQDLVGKRIGTPEYEMTAGVWIRGMLQDEYGVPVDGVDYYTGGQEEAGRPEKMALHLPENLRVRPIPPTETLSAMLDRGELDALYLARKPSCFVRGSQNVRRLFPQPREVEMAYYKKTGIFPIMHTVVIRRDVYERHPWVAQSMMKAFVRAQREAYAIVNQTAAPIHLLPWYPLFVEEVRAVLGEDFWPYGLDRNEHTLSVFLRYSYEQGLSPRQLSPRELFAPETFETFKI
ncbi:MAG: ABC transporter substrate-binding protein [Alicyclobacillus sp.]|nr:ABC transporter substrate-binding protein [Alicyclobacillus sp.]